MLTSTKKFETYEKKKNKRKGKKNVKSLHKKQKEKFLNKILINFQRKNSRNNQSFI